MAKLQNPIRALERIQEAAQVPEQDPEAVVVHPEVVEHTMAISFIKDHQAGVIITTVVEIKLMWTGIIAIVESHFPMK